MALSGKPLHQARGYGGALGGGIVALSVVQILTLGLSVGRATITQGVAVGVLLAGLAAGLAVAYAARRPAPEVDPATPPTLGARLLPGVLLAAGALAFAALWYIAYLTPDLTCDGTAYHIPPMNWWARRGHVYWVDPNFQLETLVNGYPKGVELVGYLLVLATGLSALANTLNLLFLPLGVLGIAVIARSLGASRLMALGAGAAFVLIPVNVFQAQTAYIDTAYASCAIALLAALVMARDSLARGRWPWFEALALGGATGLTLAAKGSAGLFVLAGYLGLLIAAGLGAWRAADARWRRLGRVVGFLCVAGLLGLAVGGYWYARNYLITGSPLYPVGVTLAGRTIFPGQPVEEVLWAEGNTPQLFVPWSPLRRIAFTWLQGLERWPGSILGVDNRLGGLGFYWPLGALPATLYLLYTGLRPAGDARARAVAPLAAGVLLVAFLGTPMNWWPRYTVWLYGLGLPACALAAERILRAPRLLPPLRLWLAACALVLLLESGYALTRLARDVYPRPWPASPLELLRPANWERPDNYLFPETRGTIMDDVLRSDAPVAVGPMWGISPGGRWKHNVLGALSLPIGGRDVIPLPEQVTPPMVRAAREQGVRYILWDDEVELPFALRQLVPQQVRAPGFVVLVLADG